MIDSRLGTLLKSPALSVSSGFLLAALYLLFSLAHLTNFRATGNPTMLLIVAAETVAAAFFLARSRPTTVSIIPFDWFVAVAGTFVPLFFRPTDFAILPAAGHAMVAGLLLQIFALVSLNRSFALVAAQRTIKTNRMYGIVRHPMYASYGLTFGAYLLANASWSNFIVYLSLLTLLGARIVREERLLANDATYREYMQQVRYRLVPLVY